MVKMLNRRIQILRAALVDDGFAVVPGAYSPLAHMIWASREDVSDAEKAVAGTVFAEVSARFIVRSSSFTRGITAKDRLQESGQTFTIIGLKQLGRAQIEITATARTDT